MILEEELVWAWGCERQLLNILEELDGRKQNRLIHGKAANKNEMEESGCGEVWVLWCQHNKII